LVQIDKTENLDKHQYISKKNKNEIDFIYFYVKSKKEMKV